MFFAKKCSEIKEKPTWIVLQSNLRFKKMRKNLPKLLFSTVFVFCVFQSSSYAQEKDWSIVILPTKSTMISQAILERQLQVEVDQIESLDNAELETLYERLPNRSLDEMQSRVLIYEDEKACRGVSKLFKFLIPNINPNTKYAVWDFGDESPNEREDIFGHQGDTQFAHTYQNPGIYTITVEFFDNQNRPSGEESKQRKVIVEACTAPIPPQFAVNPNIHKEVVR